jgi:hypothetical protein
MTVAWKTSQKQSQDAAIQACKGLFDSYKKTTGNATLTVDEFVNGLVHNDTGAASITTPTAAAIVAGIKGCAVGTHFFFGVACASAHAVTMVAGTGVNGGTWPTGFDVVAASSGALFMGVVTNVTASSEAVVMVPVSGAA